MLCEVYRGTWERSPRKYLPLGKSGKRELNTGLLFQEGLFSEALSANLAQNE